MSTYYLMVKNYYHHGGNFILQRVILYIKMRKNGVAIKV